MMLKREPIDRKQIVLALTVIIAVFGITYICRQYSRGGIMSHMIIVPAKIVDFHIYDRFLNHRLNYCFTPNNSPDQQCSYIDLDNVPLSEAPKIIGKYSLVVYEKNNPKNNCILLKKADFSKFNIIPPDSLQWLINIVEQ